MNHSLEQDMPRKEPALDARQALLRLLELLARRVAAGLKRERDEKTSFKVNVDSHFT